MHRSFAALVALLAASAGLAGCLTPEAATGEPADVVATFYPLLFLAERIAGDNVTVAQLVPSGVEPHDWEPSPRDVAALARAEVVLAQGAGFEPWLADLVAGVGADGPRLVDTTSGLPLSTGEAHDHDAEHEEDGAHDGEEDHAQEGAHEGEAEAEEAVDPHTWLDPVLFERQARAVEEALVDAFPEHARAFRERADALAADLDALDEAYKAGLARCERDVVIASHDAYGYLERRYGFDVLAVHGLSPEAEPDPATLKRLVDEAREHNVTIVFFEDLVSPRVVQVVADELNAETRVLSPVEGLTPEAAERGDDYVSLMRANLANLRDALGCA